MDDDFPLLLPRWTPGTLAQAYLDYAAELERAGLSVDNIQLLSATFPAFPARASPSTATMDADYAAGDRDANARIHEAFLLLDLGEHAGYVSASTRAAPEGALEAAIASAVIRRA